MVTVIRYGRPKCRPRRFLAKCRECGCEFVYDTTEVTRPRWPGFRPYVKCPCCFEEIFTTSTQVIRELTDGELE